MAKDILIEQAYQYIRNYVLENQQHGNIKINQNMLAKELGVSRTPVVKALNMLAAEGMVDNIPNHGFYIHVPTIRELSELFMLRQSFDMISGTYICQYGTEEDIQALEAIFAPFVGQESIDYQAYFEADKRFHRKLFDLCDNRLLHRISDQLQIMDRIFSIGLFRQPKETIHEHLAMLRAFRQRDESKAQELMYTHIELTRRYLDTLQRQLKALGIDPDTVSAKDVVFRNSDKK